MSPEAKRQHVEAMQKEIDKLTDAGHARWEHLPPGEVAIPSVGVFRVKSHDLHGTSLKARFCANGQAVEAPPGGWDSKADVASCSQILTVIALATLFKMSLAQIDVKSAFTQVKLNDDQRIWIRPLPGLGDPKRDKRVLRLLHHLYGHPLANAAFQDRWVEVMREFGFKVLDRNKSVFAYERRTGDKLERMLVATVVDDSIVAYSHPEIFEKWTAFLESKLPITVTDLEHVVGLRVTQATDGSISVDQQEYIEKKAEMFGVDKDTKQYKTPMEVGFMLGPRPETVNKAHVTIARELMGSLIYSTLTRPDIKFACSKLASIVLNPSTDDLKAMRRILRYLYLSRFTKMTFRQGPWTGPDGSVHEPLEACVFVDAGFAQEEGRKSQTGYAVFLGGAAIISKSCRQTQVSDSTTYSEVIALHEATVATIALRKTLPGMFASPSGPTRIYEDNQAAVSFAAKGGGIKSLHWEVKLEYVHERQTRFKHIDVIKICTSLQVADVLTKALDVNQHLYLAGILLGGSVSFGS
jgi:Reverse transcriptase (RNA-dependent DNA polymerase)